MKFIQLHWDYTETSGIEGTSEAHRNLAWILIFLTESVPNNSDLDTNIPRLTKFQVTHLHTHTRARAHACNLKRSRQKLK